MHLLLTLIKVFNLCRGSESVTLSKSFRTMVRKLIVVVPEEGYDVLTILYTLRPEVIVSL